MRSIFVLIALIWTQNGYELFQRALTKERAEGDLAGAIELYQKVIQDDGGNRVLVARALVQMGMCYERLGNPEGRRSYERVVREFADQAESVAEARKRLAEMTPPVRVADSMVVRRMWFGPDVDTLGAPTRDGRHLTYVDWATGNLSLRDLKTGHSRPLTRGNYSEGLALASRPSPDGRSIAYSYLNLKEFGVEVHLTTLDGSSHRRLFRNDDAEYLWLHDWTPDGKRVVLNVTRKDGTNQMVLLALSDSSVSLLRSFDWREPFQVSVSPDGRWIAYDFPQAENSRERDIFVLATDGSREARLVQHSANDIFPLWSPDGKQIVFVSSRTGNMGLWGQQIADGKPVGAPILIKADVGRMQPMGFTKSGALYYGLNSSMTDVYVAALDTASGIVLEPPKPVQRFVGANRFPEWSPDGNSLAYVSLPQAGPVDIGTASIVIRSVTSGLERELLPALTRRFGRPRWSPDGRSFLLTGNDARGRFGIYQVDIQTGAAHLVVRLEPITYVPLPIWSPDGKAIFYTRLTSDPSIRFLVRRELEADDETELYRGHATYMAVSPNGKWLAFRAFDLSGSTSSIMLLPTDGGEPVKIVELNAPEEIPVDALTWTPDGKYILFIKANRKTTPQTSSIWRIAPHGGKPEPLGLIMEGLSSLRIHPDGRRIAFSGGTNKNEIWVMENFLPGSKTGR
ncbi:MAG: PD40 domain-containing protein [Acidobacteria bacterium]|nr:PD40 domain-containing protein [Acidobacteriota bacterium]